MKETLQPDQFLPVNSIKGYFSRRALGLRVGKETLGEILVQENVEKHMELEEDEDSEESEDDVEVEDESDDRDNNVENKLMEGRKTAVQNILSRADVPDLKKDEWIAVNMGSCWYPAQFDKYDTDTEEIKANFLHRSSTNPQWFVWPTLNVSGDEDIGWITEDRVFYRLSPPKEGRREVLLFDEVEDVERLFKEMQ